jgi:hypothetical protein
MAITGRQFQSAFRRIVAIISPLSPLRRQIIPVFAGCCIPSNPVQRVP